MTYNILLLMQLTLYLYFCRELLAHMQLLIQSFICNLVRYKSIVIVVYYKRKHTGKGPTSKTLTSYATKKMRIIEKDIQQN